MSDPNRLAKWLLIIAMVVLSLLILYPPERKLKGGIDLVGGTSMLFEIDTTGLDPQDQAGLSSRVMEILKERVDPQGQLNLEWRPVGNTRLEIRMPRPPQEALARRDAKEQALDRLAGLNLRRFDVETALNMVGEERTAARAALERGVVERAPLSEAVEKAFDDYTAAEASGDDVRISETSTVYEDAMVELLGTSLPINRLTDILALGPGTKRQTELAKLREEWPSYDTGELASPDGQLLSKAVIAYDGWAEDKAELEDPSDLKRRIRGAGVLEFRILAERDPSSPSNVLDSEKQSSESISKYTLQLAKRGPRKSPGDRFAWFSIESPLQFFRADDFEDLNLRKDDPASPVFDEYAGKYYVLTYDVASSRMLQSTGRKKWSLKAAYPDRDYMSGEPIVSFTLDARGGQRFGSLTGTYLKKNLCIVLDKQAMSYATIQDRITERGRISGSFTPDRVQDLVRTLEAGSLPARLKETPLMEKTIGPSLGKVNREKGFRAAAWGLIAVTAFVLFYYGFAAGGMADIALALNMLFVLAAMAFLQATFTLPGIAGLILTIGMAIDANVLIFERIREEVDRGIVFKKALNLGYDKAFSTIMDANLTTLITCIILGFVGSEEVKGFAIVLGIGIVASMFTALFVTRLVFNTLIARGTLKAFSMRRLIGCPSIDWLSMRRVFWPVSLVVAGLGLFLFVEQSVTNKEAIFDIEFLGGTSIQVDLKPGVELTDEEMADRVRGSGSGEGTSAVEWLGQAAEVLAEATAAEGEIAGEFTLTSNAPAIAPAQLGILMRSTLEDAIERGGIEAIDRQTVAFATKPGALTLDTFKEAVAEAVAATRESAAHMSNARVQSVADIDAAEGVGLAFEIVTIATNRELVQEAILATMGNKLRIQRGIKFEVIEDEQLLHEPYFVVEADDRYLRDVVGGDAAFDVRRFRGGVAIHVRLDGAETLLVADLERRLREVSLQTDAEHYRTRETAVFPLGSGSAEAGYNEFAVLAVEESVLTDEIRVGDELWKEALARPQLTQVEAALSREKSLTKVVRFDPQIAGQAQSRAAFAVILALAAIISYLWLRFGDKEFGLAAIVALVHDVSVTLGLVSISRFVAGTVVGDFLAIEAFRVDLPMIAAVMTVIGYSLNDTIVVFDRIRENRGKIGALQANIINNSLNQTLSRTVLTSLTTFLVVFVLYCFGGSGVHGFCFALLIGVVIGTYSSIGIAAPMLYRPLVLRVVVTVIAALTLIGMTFLAIPNQTVELVVVGLIVVACLGMVLKLLMAGGYSQPGRAVAA